MNQFGDLTLDEYRFFFLGLRSHFSNETKQEGSAFLPPSGVTLPDTVDWRTKGYVTPVKDQGMFSYFLSGLSIVGSENRGSEVPGCHTLGLISFTEAIVRTSLNGIINSTKGRYCSVAFI